MKSIPYDEGVVWIDVIPRRRRPLLTGIICLFLGSKRPEKGMKFTPPSHYEGAGLVWQARTKMLEIGGRLRAVQIRHALSSPPGRPAIVVTDHR